MADQDDDSLAWTCPLPFSHDRFEEAHYFLHRMEIEYHRPALFRFHLNAYVSALRAVHEMLRKELERNGHAAWWKIRSIEFREDDVLARFARGRNVALHQRAILEGSRVQLGLFRGHKLKLTIGMETQTDEPSEDLLTRMAPRLVGFLIDEDHVALGEQLGVQRTYFVRELSEDEDVLRASRRALARTTRALSEAHKRMGAEHEASLDEDLLDERQLLAITTLLETDIDPTAATRWGW